MRATHYSETSQILTSVVPKLSLVTSLSELTQIIAEAARQLTGADGTTFVLRDQNQCYYADEDAISPLWKGRRFPLETCISGWSMLHREVAVIPDIYADSRIPHEAYRPTFVKSLCMVPIRNEKPMGAIGSYWAEQYVPTQNEIKALQILADTASVALENLELKQAANRHVSEASDWKEKNNHLELTMYSMAHDLRSPVSIMTGLGEILKSQVASVSDPNLYKNVLSIVETGRRTAQQIDRMLSLYRATNGEIEKQDVDVSDFAKRVVSGYVSVFSIRTIDVDIEPNIHVYADPSLIYILLENLLSNAIKYSSKKPESKIQVGCLEKTDEKITFFVKDNGQGFSSEQTSKLFKPLSRLDSKWEFGGVGLGLASVAHIVSLHEGKVRADGEENAGATFYVTLPQRRLLRS